MEKYIDINGGFKDISYWKVWVYIGPVSLLECPGHFWEFVVGKIDTDAK